MRSFVRYLFAKLTMTKISRTIAALVALAFLYPLTTRAELANGKFGAAQVFDVQRSPALPTANNSFTVSGFATPFSDTTQYTIQPGQYIMFFKVTDSPCRYGITLYNADDTVNRVIASSGTIYGIAPQGFLHDSSIGSGTFVANSAGYATGSSLTYTPPMGEATCADTAAYLPNTVPRDTSGNAAPVARNVTITGTAHAGVQLTGSYTYADADSDAQGTSTFRWVRNTANTGVGGGTDVATTQNYTALAGDQGKYLYFCATPVASAGTATGTEVCSSATAAVAAAAPPPAPVTEPIPVVVPATSKVDPGVNTAVSPKDLSSGQGPTMVACLTDTLTPAFAPAAVTYLGQKADGSARYTIATSPAQTLSFYPLTATTATGSGITLSSNNVLTVATSCGTFAAEPALANRSEFGALLASMGLTAAINAQGVITIQAGSTIYVARPDYLVTTGTPGTPSLKQGSDGLYRFTDNAGAVQVLRPAFLEPDVLRTALLASLGAQFVSFVVQTDGTGLLTTLVNGATQTAVLTPALTLGTVYADHFADSVWGSGSTWTYRVYAFANATQGFTSTAK
jgi:hypothetical protein